MIAAEYSILYFAANYIFVLLRQNIISFETMIVGRKEEIAELNKLYCLICEY